MANKVTPHLMFDGTAEEAMNFYVSLFANSEILETEKYGAGEPGVEGAIKRAAFTVGGREFGCMDTPVKHDFTFTPSTSLFVECDDEAELDAAYERLSEGGTVLMPLDNYGFSKQFGWVNDRFGVSWQLNLK
jgi:predicted 3-demethylubiquinone-9 3-methyltransferase (glyoxalase superfamily)